MSEKNYQEFPPSDNQRNRAQRELLVLILSCNFFQTAKENLTELRLEPVASKNQKRLASPKLEDQVVLTELRRKCNALSEDEYFLCLESLLARMYFGPDIVFGGEIYERKACQICWHLIFNDQHYLRELLYLPHGGHVFNYNILSLMDVYAERYSFLAKTNEVMLRNFKENLATVCRLSPIRYSEELTILIHILDRSTRMANATRSSESINRIHAIFDLLNRYMTNDARECFLSFAERKPEWFSKEALVYFQSKNPSKID